MMCQMQSAARFPRVVPKVVVMFGLVASPLVSCSSSHSESVTLLAYDSFTLPDGAFDDFTQATGIRVDVAIGGDAGELVSKAVLSAGNPEGDVLWGVDNTLLGRALESDVFEPYVSPSPNIDERLAEAGQGTVTPVDVGYVCVNYDIAALKARNVSPPTNLDDLVEPQYAGMLVVQNPTTSSVGLAFVLATVSRYDQGWIDYWRALVDNDVTVVDSWTDSYYSWFTRHGGDRPLVVSYSTSPPAEVIFAEPPLAAGSAPPTGVATGTCFEQVEFAGILRGTRHARAAQLLIDYLLGPKFQELLPENLFVYPANTAAVLPDRFVSLSTPITAPLTMQPEEIARRRSDLIEQWLRITGS